MSHNPKSLSKMNRNLIERERRSQFKTLVSRLFNLLPPHPSKMSMPELVEYATAHIKQMQERVEELKRIRKVQLEGQQPQTPKDDERITPVLEITDSESTVDVNLIAGSETTFVLPDIITILEGEGAEVISANYNISGNRIFLSVHSQAAYSISRIGIENSRVRERLERLQISLQD